jgi:hypothetical protein
MPFRLVIHASFLYQVNGTPPPPKKKIRVRRAYSRGMYVIVGHPFNHEAITHYIFGILIYYDSGFEAQVSLCGLKAISLRTCSLSQQCLILQV